MQEQFGIFTYPTPIFGADTGRGTFYWITFKNTAKIADSHVDHLLCEAVGFSARHAHKGPIFVDTASWEERTRERPIGQMDLASTRTCSFSPSDIKPVCQISKGASTHNPAFTGQTHQVTGNKRETNHKVIAKVNSTANRVHS